MTLTSDFGAGSGFPAQMKGVILGLAPDIHIVDLSHDIPAYDVLAAALMLEAVVPHFPFNAVHCAVVDPGVGSDRKAICVVNGEGRRFVGPDNGIFTPFYDGTEKVWELSDHHFVPVPASATFHGRDLFAPVAAWLAQDVEPEKMGPRVPVAVRLAWPEPEKRASEVVGFCVLVDPFGNLVTSIKRGHLPALKGGYEVWAEGRRARFVRTYSDGKRGELLSLFGSGGRLEIAEREGNAARRLDTGVGARVTVKIPSK